MPGAKLPAVRLPSAVDEEGRVPTPGAVELPASSKFGFAWPAEAPPIVQAPLSSDRAVSLSSSEGESDHSEAENTSGLQSQTDHSDENELTPTVHRSLKSEQQILTEKMVKAPSIPRFSRAVSMPLLSTLGHLQNPRRPSHSSHTSNCSISEVPPEYSQFHEVSLELADSVQMMVQTLLQISPSQVFDPTKEQFSACSLSVPTPCISAMFTSMKNLNYISANMATFCAADSSRDSGLDPSSEPHGAPSVPSTVPDDFDIGELLQSVGDTLSGAAAQVGVDLVLYHGDVGMKHIAVKGDECGISYALSHIVRQVINTARRGDSIEIGLSVGILPSKSRDAREPDTTPNSESIPQAPASPSDGPLSCSFDITHNFAPSDTSSANEPSRGLPQPPGAVSRPSPTFNMLILQRLLSQVGASFSCDLRPKKLVGGRSCELTLTLERGLPSVIGTRMALSKEDVSYQLLSGVRIAEEPTLEELAQFAETLRGRKVTLYASSKGSFARHLTSYLTAWGLDVSHVSAESSMDGNAPQSDSSQGSSPSVTGQRMLGGSFLQSVPYGISLEAFSQAIPHQMPPPTPSAAPRPVLASGLSFVFIDDDVTVLRERLRKLRLQQAYPLTLSRKRPSLATHHRPRSTPQVQRAGGMGTSLAVVIVHFTSLTNYKLVKEVIQSDLASHGATSTVPEVMIIPKPAGPRRFLTALHTAVTKPIVDPFFTPIATSPITTSQASFFNLNTSNTRTPSPKSPTASSGPSRTNSDRSTKSPKETSGEPANLPPPSPLNISDSMEYFSEAAAKLGASPSSGLVIQSPSGQPAGIFFHPKGKGKGSSAMERERGQFLVPSEQAGAATARRISNGKEAKSPRTHSPMSFSSLHSVSAIPVSNPLLDIESQPAPAGLSKSKGKKPSSPRMESTPVPTSPRRGSSMSTTSTSIKVATPPTSSGNETTNTSPMSRRNARRSAGELTHQAGLKGPTDTNIVVPPISVLIVDDNPINQTILSTFMKKKKIKYDVAKNGEEAVQKWLTGGFHLILMDIQMPVMDGIQATKEIRLMEKMNSSSGFPLSTPRSEGRTPSEAPSSATSTSSPYRSSVIIVALTASSLQSDRVAALAAGCNDYHTKPVSLQWLNNKIIEWGSIKALQMWADLRPEAVKSISSGQAAQAHKVAQGLHVPEGRITPSDSPSRSSSRPRTTLPSDAPPGTALTPSSQLIGSSRQAMSFPTKDDFSDTPSSDNPVSDFEHRPASCGAATTVKTTNLPPNITPTSANHTDGDLWKQDEEVSSTSNQKSAIPVI